jgi:hypothetical protein
MQPSIYNIRLTLRNAYENYRNQSDQNKKDLMNKIIDASNKFHYKNIGDKICSLGVL